MFGFFEKLIDPFPPGEPTRPPRGLFRFLLHYARPALPWLLLMSLMTVAVSVMEITFLGYMGTLVDWLGGAERSTFLADHGSGLLAMAALVVIGYPLLVLVLALVTNQTIFGNFPMLGRWLSHRWLLDQSLPFFQDEFAGRISQKVMQTALAVRETTMKLMEVLVYVVVYFSGALVLVGSADARLTLPLLAWLAGYIVIASIFVPRLGRISMAQADARSLMTGRIVDSYTNIQTLKLFAHPRHEEAYARDAMDGFMVTVHRQMRLVTVLTVSLHTLNALLLAGIAAMTIHTWLQSAISLGSIAVAIALVIRIRAMSEWVLWELAGLFENIGTVQDGIDTLSLPRTVVDRDDARELGVGEGRIDFEQVRFAYGAGTRAAAPGKAPVIDAVSLAIRPGEKIGLVGRSGAGKSTLVNLLLRFHDLEGGRIAIDGQDIAAVTQQSLRRHIGMVTQDTSLLHRSIRDNIRYGRPDASEEEIVDAARRAHAHEFIVDLVDHAGRSGYDAHAGERGVKLSGGQRQRIAIARILLKNAPILVLDEATSALDSEVEAAIQENLYELMQGKTVIAIAHRLSTIAAMDRLVVLDAGRIVEQGSREELLAHQGLYAQLWQRQSGGFLGEGEAAQAA